MKIFLLHILAGFCLISNCYCQVSKNKEVSAFLNTFEEVEMPFLLNKSYYEGIYTGELIKLDTSAVSTFIEENRNVVAGRKLFDFYSYYSLFKFEIGGGITAVVYLRSGGAGGIERYFYLNTLKEGKKISSLLIGKQIASCAREQLRESKINDDRKIEIQDSLKAIDCSTEKVKNTEVTHHEYFIRSNGEVVER